MLSSPSPYSPFFTSGLLSEGSTSRISKSFNEDLGPRRGSLPTDTPPSLSGASSAKIQSSGDESSAFYFTLQPRRDSIALRSFLSLDLAESQSIRSASLRRQASTTATKITSSSSSRRKVPAPLNPTSWGPSSPRSAYRAPPSPLRSPIRRRSGDSFRTLPSPKPAPSMTLPDVPTPASDRPPVLPPIIPSPRLSFMSTVQPPSPVSPPAAASPTPTSTSTLAAPTSPVARSFSVTSTERRTSREDALASLEGRGEGMDKDFMDMSDEDDTESFDSQLAAAVDEDEHVIIVSPPPVGKSKSSTGRQRKRRSTIESWFPLASFIDFKDEDSTWNWRNFIEVGGAT